MEQRGSVTTRQRFNSLTPAHNCLYEAGEMTYPGRPSALTFTWMEFGDTVVRPVSVRRTGKLNWRDPNAEQMRPTLTPAPSLGRPLSGPSVMDDLCLQHASFPPCSCPLRRYPYNGIRSPVMETWAAAPVISCSTDQSLFRCL